ncbi:MAG TPA: hypothetical protein VI524_04470 [Anaerolineales bacterium]|nr:hypothetical protein [Anaerolineales bacterium]
MAKPLSTEPDASPNRSAGSGAALNLDGASKMEGFRIPMTNALSGKSKDGKKTRGMINRGMTSL